MGYSLPPRTHHVRGFPTLRLPCPFRLPMKASEFRWGFPCLRPTLLSILHGVSRVRLVGLPAKGCRWRVSACPFRSLRLPSIDTRYVRFTRVAFCDKSGRYRIGPYSLLTPEVAGSTGGHLRQGVAGWSFPVGLFALQVIHHGISQPSTASWILAFSSRCLLGTCCSPHEVAHGA